MVKRPALVYLTYLFENTNSFEASKSFGFTTPVHCNYIQKIYTEDLNNKVVSISFPNDTIFRFMQDSTGITTTGIGWNAEKMYAVMQLIETTDQTVKPKAGEWRKVDITDQIANYATWDGITTIPPTDIVNSIMTVSYDRYLTSPIYNLSYLNYPTSDASDNLTFGEEVFFFGNISGEIKATIYEMEVNIILPLNEFNTSNNPTWKVNTPVYITEIGLYDDDGNLLAVGKLNIPVEKDSTKYRTIQLKHDF